MKSYILKVSWNNTKKILKKEFDELYDKDPLLLEIGQNKILYNIQTKLDKTKEEIRTVLSE